MKSKIKKVFMRSMLWVFAKIVYLIYTIAILIFWKVEEQQMKRGFKDRGEKKYTNEDFVFFALFIPNGIPLTGPDIRKHYIKSELSKEHIYKIIDLRKYANTHKPEYINFIRSEYLRKLYPEIYS